MAASATVRELRNQFPKVRRLVETEGEVVVTEQGTPKYRLTPYTAPGRQKTAPPKDYAARLRRHQPRPLSVSAAKGLHEADRGER